MLPTIRHRLTSLRRPTAASPAGRSLLLDKQGLSRRPYRPIHEEELYRLPTLTSDPVGYVQSLWLLYSTTMGVSVLEPVSVCGMSRATQRWETRKEGDSGSWMHRSSLLTCSSPLSVLKVGKRPLP